MGEQRAVRFRIRGRVQGVGFRYFVLRAARALGVGGWVRNCRDGSVEAVAQGDADALARFRAELRQGPPGSRVEEIAEAEHDGGPVASNFEIVG